VIPASELANIDLAAFWRWADEHIGDLASPTYAQIRTDAPQLDANIPGDDLPDPEQYAPTRVPCGKSRGPLRDAVEEWEVRAAGLAGVPVSAENRADFNWTLSGILQMEPYRTKGVAWVSSRPATLAYLAGYCAVDTRDYALAEGFLTTAVDLLPRAAQPKLELAQALVAQRKLEQADALVQLVIDTARDECDLAHAWRKRGYILFEQGELVEARSSYIRSLDFDPTSQLAISELKLLEAEIVAHGGDPQPYEPPPSEQFVTHCQGSG
jgi:tetratricopeptide (TPR) repeat protein